MNLVNLDKANLRNVFNFSRISRFPNIHCCLAGCLSVCLSAPYAPSFVPPPFLSISQGTDTWNVAVWSSRTRQACCGGCQETTNRSPAVANGFDYPVQRSVFLFNQCMQLLGIFWAVIMRSHFASITNIFRYSSYATLKRRQHKNIWKS